MKFLGHRVHQQFIVFPLGLLATAVVFDILALTRGTPFWFQISFWMIAAGIIGALAATVFAAVDWLAIPANTSAKRIALWHGLGNVLVTLLFIVSWVLRKPSPGNPGQLCLLLSFAAVALGANLNAPSLLSERSVASRSASESNRAA